MDCLDVFEVDNFRVIWRAPQFKGIATTMTKMLCVVTKIMWAANNRITYCLLKCGEVEFICTELNPLHLISPHPHPVRCCRRNYSDRLTYFSLLLTSLINYKPRKQELKFKLPGHINHSDASRWRGISWMVEKGRNGRSRAVVHVAALFLNRGSNLKCQECHEW